MTFSPFYMGNHTKPWDIDEEGMRPSSYTMAENWGGQVNFMIPLDREGLRRCRSIAARQEEKMRLDYELVRMKECASLMQKGFMIRPGTDFAHLCNDVMAISKFKEIEAKVLAKRKACNPIKKPWYKPWQKEKLKCND